MANWRKPSERASETVTFRLRPDERRLFEHLAEVSGTGLSELLRELIRRRADELGIEQVPEAAPRRRPGRPRRSPPPAPGPVPAPMTAAPPPVELPPAAVETVAAAAADPEPDGLSGPCFGDLVDDFVTHFGERGEGTRRELAETVDFLTAPREGGPILPRETPVEAIDSRRLSAARDRLSVLDVRLSRKNLFLTYLRMMMQFALKADGPRPEVNPVLDLAPFTARELGSWPAPPGTTGEAP